MLISKVSEGNDVGLGDAREISTEEDHTHEYQTASELFEIMAKDHSFDTNGNDPLTTGDLVILYKNIDLGTKLMTNANEIKLKKPNQYVETVIYNEDLESDGSEISEIYSTEDLRNVFMVNNERIDLLRDRSSLENTLCHKFGDIEIKSSELATQYNKRFHFQDPYIKEQFNICKLNSMEYDGTILPASLLDFICCKRLEDNYNFYMENIIRYVKHTIEQLKRISNGDYLTHKAKEKWKEVKNINEIHDTIHNKTKVLATSTSIPLHVEQKITGHASTWDDIVHSEVDVRSLSKILEKKIVVEVPKLICASYRLFSTRCVDNFIISCKRENQSIIKDGKHEESRVDVVLQLERSQTGQVMSNISSIMILQAAPNVQEPLSLTYKEIESSEDVKNAHNIKIVEIDQDYDDNNNAQHSIGHPTIESNDNYFRDGETYEDSVFDTNDYPGSENDLNTSKNYSCIESSESSDVLRDIIDKNTINQGDTLFTETSPDELRLTMQRLNMQTSLPEESAEEISLNTNTSKKKSPTRVRIKSPYENKSYILEEKKRKKLLEIREKREKKKQALGENCKVTKHKYGKSAIMPQPSSSVTKLSITNKSFYNSIYGQAIAIENSKASKGKGTEQKVPVSRGPKKVSIPEMSFDATECEQESPMLTPEKNNKKYINRSYYLDDAETEMMYIPMKTSENSDPKDCSASTSAVSSEFRDKLTLFSQLIRSSTTDFHDRDEIKSPSNNSLRLDAMNTTDAKNGNNTKNINTSQSVSNMKSSKNPGSVSFDDKNITQKTIVPSISSVECRKSIEKVYQLMNKLGKIDVVQLNKSTSKIRMNVNKSNVIGGRESSTFQASDSGTSLKHHLTSSNPSCFSFENNTKDPTTNIVPNKSTDSPVVPKVIISTKLQIPKIDYDKNKRGKRTAMNPLKLPENPLKAISQLLHEFDNVQKIRQKTVDPKVNKKPDGITDDRCVSRQSSLKRRSRFDQHIKDIDKDKASRIPTPRALKTEVPRIHQQVNIDDKNDRFPFDKATKIPTPRRPKMEAPRNLQQMTIDEKNFRKRKIIADIIDEEKEARGEAVRGPSKFTSRLNTLAQPKRSYVQAHSEEYQTRYGRNLMADRLQRLAAVPLSVDGILGSANSRNKMRRSGAEVVSAVSVKSPPVSPLDKQERARRSASSSPHGKRQSPLMSRKHNVPQRTDTVKKMVSVESYVKSNYGRASSDRSRVPHLPSDIELVSLTSANTVEESTELGSKLHRMVDCALHANPAPLAALPETLETLDIGSEPRGNTDTPSLADNLSRADERMSVDSDFPVDILGDKNVVTAVENVQRKEMEETVKYELQAFNSLIEIEKLENALHRRLSVGTFQKKLRIKNLTLTPKQSMPQFFKIQGGDAGSLLVESTISQNFKIINSKKKLDVKTMPDLSSSHLDWTFADFPMQIATIGCAFPQYRSVQSEASTKINSLNNDNRSIVIVDNVSNKNRIVLDKDSQCFKGQSAESQPKACVEQAAQVNALHDIIVPDNSIATPNGHIDAIPEMNEASKASNVLETNIKEEEIDANHVINETCKDSNVMEKNVKEEEKYATLVINETSKPADVLETNINEAEICNDEVKGKSAAEVPNDDVDYTTSLDMLVGLLNEIQKITTCQTHITNAASDVQCKEIETILKEAVASEHCGNPLELVSITSLDKLRNLESNPSIYSFYLSSDGDQDTVDSRSMFNDNFWKPGKPVCDKEVNVDFAERECVNCFTEMPSIFPITLNHSTNVTNSLIGILSEPSSQSMYSLVEYDTFHSHTSIHPHNTVIQLPGIESIDNNSQHFLVPYREVTKNISENLNKKEPPPIVEDVTEKDLTPSPEELTVKKKIISTTNKRAKVLAGKNLSSILIRKGFNSDFDPLMKMKRDILVTVYSILVFTVFAALSFPEMLYQVLK